MACSRVCRYGALTTADAVAATKMAEEVGADAVSVITLLISPTSRNRMNTLLRSPTLLRFRCCVQQRGRTGVNISADLVERLAKIDNVKGIKDSSGDLTLQESTCVARQIHSQFLSDGYPDLCGTLHGGKGSSNGDCKCGAQISV